MKNCLSLELKIDFISSPWNKTCRPLLHQLSQRRGVLQVPQREKGMVVTDDSLLRWTLSAICRLSNLVRYVVSQVQKIRDGLPNQSSQLITILFSSFMLGQTIQQKRPWKNIKGLWTVRQEGKRVPMEGQHQWGNGWFYRQTACSTDGANETLDFGIMVYTARGLEKNWCGSSLQKGRKKRIQETTDQSTSITAKILKKIIKRWICVHLERNKVITRGQHVFVKNRSCQKFCFLG